MGKSFEQLCKNMVVTGKTVTPPTPTPQAPADPILTAEPVNLTEMFRSTPEKQQVNELSQKTLKSYISKASADAADAALNASVRGHSPEPFNKTWKDSYMRSFRRREGINQALSKLKEDTEVTKQVAPDQVEPTKKKEEPKKSIEGPIEEKKKYTSVEKAKVVAAHKKWRKQTNEEIVAERFNRAAQIIGKKND